MTFLTFFPERPPEVHPPGRVYARVDRLEPRPRDGEEASTAVLDSVDADWFDRMGREWEWLGDRRVATEVERNVSILEIPYRDGVMRSELALKDDDAWLELTLTDGGPWPEVLHFLNLFAAPLVRSLVEMRQAEPQTERELNRKTSIDVLPEASPAEVEGLLAAAESPDGAAVYDVGQGACNALLGGRQPRLYFDFGGGARGNAPSFPPQLTKFCFTSAPPIVLSHWDEDHWSSAGRDSDAYSATWLAPRQKIGVMHNAHIAKIHAAGGSVLLWPAAKASMTRGALTVEKCTGRKRNDSGLALVVDGPDGKRMLFPADARYDFVPSSGLDFTHLVAAHHGGLPTPTRVPASDGESCGRLVYSYGFPNGYGHPVPSVMAAHSAWPFARSRETTHRTHAGLGHVHLYWDDAAPAAHPPCAGHTCNLTCEQR